MDEKVFVRRADLRFFLSIFATGLMSFMGVVIETAMNVTFPTLMREFSVGTATVQWITTGYLLVLAVMLPTSSFLKHRFPMRRLFLAACSCFIVGTLLSAQATSFPPLLGGRLLQGLGTGVALPLMFNIVMEQAPLAQIGTMMGAAMLTIALAPAVGPSLGGYIVFTFGWRMIFWALLPVLVFALVAGGLAIRQSSATGPRAFDWRGWLALVVAFCGLIFACDGLGKLPGELASFAACAVLFLAALLWFVRHEEKEIFAHHPPLLNVRVLRSAPFLLALTAQVLLQTTCLGIGFLLPNFAQLTLGTDAFAAGCILLPGCVIGAALAPVAGRLYDRLGARFPLLFGAVCMFLAVLAYWGHIGAATVLTLTAIYCLFTVGQSLTAGNSMTYALSCLPNALRSDGNAIFNTGVQLAGAIGTTLAAAIVSFSQRGQDLAAGTAEGTALAFLLFLVLASGEAVAITLALRHQRKIALPKAASEAAPALASQGEGA